MKSHISVVLAIFVVLVSNLVITNAYAITENQTDNPTPEFSYSNQTVMETPNASRIVYPPLTSTPSGNQAAIDMALAVPGLQNWSHDWKYVAMSFLGNNKAGTPDFKWRYDIIDLNAPSDSAPFPCDGGWWASVEVDMETMKIVYANYPTMESHGCNDGPGGDSGPGGRYDPSIVVESTPPQLDNSTGNQSDGSNSTASQSSIFNNTSTLSDVSNNVTSQMNIFNDATSHPNISNMIQSNIPANTKSPLQQFDSGVAAKEVTCKGSLQLVIEPKDGAPACVRPQTASILAERGWSMAS